LESTGTAVDSSRGWPKHYMMTPRTILDHRGGKVGHSAKRADCCCLWHFGRIVLNLTAPHDKSSRGRLREPLPEAGFSLFGGSNSVHLIPDTSKSGSCRIG
jgi:hypothetical protein